MVLIVVLIVVMVVVVVVIVLVVVVIVVVVVVVVVAVGVVAVVVTTGSRSRGANGRLFTSVVSSGGRHDTNERVCKSTEAVGGSSRQGMLNIVLTCQ